MAKISLLVVSLLAFVLSASAQSYTDHLQANEEGKGRVTINEPMYLDSLINNIRPEIAKVDSASVLGTGAGGAMAYTGAGRAGGAGAAAATGTRKGTGVTHTIKSGETVNVFSIQVYSGGNSRDAKQKAQAIAAQVNAKCPGSGAHASFRSPRWVVITGAYASQEVAQANLKRMKAMGFSQASIFRRSVVKK